MTYMWNKSLLASKSKAMYALEYLNKSAFCCHKIRTAKQKNSHNGKKPRGKNLYWGQAILIRY